jgi:hypothetical protein
LLAAKHNASPFEVLATYSGWGTVHDNNASYARRALTLVDKVLAAVSNSHSQLRPPPPAPAKSREVTPAPPPGAISRNPATPRSPVRTTCLDSPAVVPVAAHAAAVEASSITGTSVEAIPAMEPASPVPTTTVAAPAPAAAVATAAATEALRISLSASR